MFSIVQYVLNNFKICSFNNLISFSLFFGALLYIIIYIYILIYKPQTLNNLYQWIIYIIILDILLSLFYYINLEKENKKFNFEHLQSEKISSHDSLDSESDITDNDVIDNDDDKDDKDDNDNDNLSLDSNINDIICGIEPCNIRIDEINSFGGNIFDIENEDNCSDKISSCCEEPQNEIQEDQEQNQDENVEKNDNDKTSNVKPIRRKKKKN